LSRRTPPDPIAEARALIEAGEAARAVDLLKSRIDAGRGGLLARLALGRALIAAGDLPSALAHMRELVQSSPGFAEAAFALGEALLAAGHLPTAIAEFERALRLDPGLDQARYALGSAWLEAGEPARATEILLPLAAHPALAEMAARKIAEAEGMGRTNRAAAGYVRHLFDQFSADYDRRMLDELSYSAHRIMRGLADLVLPHDGRKLDILDLGCGTGLAGEAFRDLARRLDGVDLSPGMIERARAREIYTSLATADLESFLAAGRPSYDVILAADTLVYLGDLAPVMSGARRCLRAGACLLFTVERKMGDGYELGPKRRYRHSESYLRRLAAEAGFEVMGLIACSPRTEAREPVEGLAVALQPWP
jgi:predicted TPR repeat methyltransferase